jgi:indole-3-glycerol phosphate synthase
MTILDEIFAHKSEEVERRRRDLPLQEVRALAERGAAPRDFIAALRRGPGQRPALIAEVKRASPSRGLISTGFDPLRLARLYQENGASAISVLTDERFFLGSLDYLCQIHALELGTPLLRKDFILDPYQVFEARAAGADAILLIAACLEDALLQDLYGLAQELGMAALVEVHNLKELQRALPRLNPALVGINNRDLRDFSVDLDITLRLRPEIPEEVCVVAESGIHTPEDVERLAPAPIDAILVGEALVAAADTASLVRRLAR